MKIFSPFIATNKKIRAELIALTTTPLLRGVLLLPIALIFVMLLILVFYVKRLPPQVPIYYSRPWGEEQLAPAFMLLLLPLGSLIWYILSILLIHFQTKEYRVFSQLILLVQAVVCVMALLTELNILQLVI